MPGTNREPAPFLPEMGGEQRLRLISPAGPVLNEKAFSDGCGILRAAGIKIEEGERRGGDYLAGSDDERLAELYQAAAADGPGTILADRGGYGSQRLLPKLDPAVFTTRPKRFCGSSDISILLNFIAKHTGLITFHTPMPINLARVDDESRARTISLIKGELPATPPPLVPYRAGVAAGRLFGGNFTVLCHLLATPYAIDFSGAILFIEDINEPLYRIDRIFQQLKQARALAGVRAILLGDFIANNEIIDPEKIAALAASAVEDGCPIFTGLACGHGRQNLPLPVGCECGIDAKGRLAFHYPRN